MKAKGYNGQFASSSFAGIGLLDDLQDASHGLIMSQVLPPPQRTNLKLVADYQAHLKDFSPSAVPNYTSLEGYVAARVLVEGLRRINGAASPSKLIAALEQIERLDLGGYEVGFSGKQHNGSRFVDTAIVSRERALRF
jgi:branched-chain amino acid transport system substrate-binding protein